MLKVSIDKAMKIVEQKREFFKGKKVLVTGAAGFIGFHLAKKMCEHGFSVYGIDNLNEYYDVNLKNERLKILEKYAGLLPDSSI